MFPFFSIQNNHLERNPAQKKIEKAETMTEDRGRIPFPDALTKVKEAIEAVTKFEEDFAAPAEVCLMEGPLPPTDRLADFCDEDRRCVMSMIDQWNEAQSSPLPSGGTGPGPSEESYQGIIWPPFHRLCFVLPVQRPGYATRVVFVLDSTALCTTLSAATWQILGLSETQTRSLISIADVEVDVAQSLGSLKGVDVLGTDFLKASRALLTLNYGGILRGTNMRLR